MKAGKRKQHLEVDKEVSRVTFADELGRERVVIMDYEECRYKTNGKCYNNRNMKKLGKVCRGCEKWKEEKR